MVASIYVNNIVSGGISDTLMEGSTLLSQSKYARNYVKKLGLSNGSHTRTLTPPHLKLSKKTKGESVDQSLCKSPGNGCFFLRKNLMSWISKKQNCVALDSVEIECIAARSNYSQMI